MKLLNLSSHKSLQDLTFKGVNFVIFFSIMINILMLFIPLYTLQVYDRVLISHSVDTLLALSLGVVLSILIISTLETIKSYILTRIGNEMQLKSSQKVLNAAISKSLDAGNIQLEPTRDLSKVVNFISNNSIGLISLLDLPWIPIFVIIVYLIHPVLGITMASFMILLFIITVISNHMTSSHYESSHDNHNKADRRVMEIMHNAGAIEAMGMRENMLKYWQEFKLNGISSTSKATDLSSLFKSMARFLRLLQSISITGIGAYFVINNELTVGAMIAANILGGRGAAPLESFIASYKSLLESKESLARLDQTLEEYHNDTPSTKLPAPKGEISIENLEYSLSTHNEPILKDISLNIQKGAIIGILGSSASGKSTLAKALVGIIKPTKGNVRLDNSNIYEWSSNEIGKYIGYLPQDIMLFDGTVKDNIARFSQCEDEDVTNAAILAGAHEMILRLPKGYDTQIGSGGIALSGGQRQRIALARALFGDPKLLVLDEPNSNLDTEGDIALLNAMKKIKQNGITTILITHKPMMTANADKLIIMANGEIKLFDDREKVLDILQNKANQTRIEQ